MELLLRLLELEMTSEDVTTRIADCVAITKGIADCASSEP